MRILVVDDNRSSADALQRALSKKGYEAVAHYDGASAIDDLEAFGPDLVLTDLKMEPVGGMEVLDAARQLRPPPEVIVFTAYGAIETAVEAMRLGARDFLTKPVTLDQLLRRLEDLDAERSPASAPPLPEVAPSAPAVAVADTLAADRRGPPPSRSADPFADFVAESPATRDLLETLRRVVDVPSPVWIEGEIGCGRGHVARTLHAARHPEQPFTVFDVARDTPWPTQGTVLLPNVDDLPRDLQQQLVRRLRHTPDSVRLVATASNEAPRRVHEGRLMSELYYGLAVIVVRVPRLADRTADIVPLLEQSLDRFSSRYGRPRPDITARHVEALLEHSWPGNIRELLNVAERAVVLGEEALALEVIRRATPGLPDLTPGFQLSTYLDDLERSILIEALRRTAGDRNAAGRLLGVERNTLRYKLKKYELL